MSKLHAATRFRCDLAAETLGVWGTLRLRATGSSMLPAIRPGEILHIDHRTLSQLQLGQIAAFTCYGRLVIHRLIKVNPRSFVTRGDSLPAPDPVADETQLLGVVVAIERNGLMVTPSLRPAIPAPLAAMLFGSWPRISGLLFRPAAGGPS